MYNAAIAEMLFFGMWVGLLMLSLITRWSDTGWSDRFGTCVILLFVILLFCLSRQTKNEILKRQPVISVCDTIYVEGRTSFHMTDSTLRCERGEEPRFEVIKNEPKMEPNDSTACIHCGKLLIHHYDVSSTKTDEQLETEGWIDYMNAP